MRVIRTPCPVGSGFRPAFLFDFNPAEVYNMQNVFRRFAMKRLLCIVMLLAMLCPVLGEVLCEDGVAITEELVVEYGYEYYDRDEVALYLHAFCELPVNYITKREAMDLGWDSRQGNLWDVAYGACIGGDRFGNYEGLLPEQKGRRYYECDVNYEGGYRESCRLIFSNDGLIYYTEDHYETFTLMYEGWYEADAEYIPAAA